MSICCGSVCYGGEFEFKTALVSALSGIVPIVREGVYTGEDAEKYIGRKADKNRKIYNGMLKTYFYQFMGPRPPKRSQENRNVD